MNDQNLAFRVRNCAFQSTMGPSRFENFWLTGKKVWFAGFGLVFLTPYIQVLLIWHRLFSKSKLPRFYFFLILTNGIFELRDLSLLDGFLQTSIVCKNHKQLS